MSPFGRGGEMTRIVRLATVWMLGVLAFSSAAAGAEERSNELRLDLGFGSQIGAIGLSYTRSLVSMLDLEVGVGDGFTGCSSARCSRGASAARRIASSSASGRRLGSVGRAKRRARSAG